MQSIRILCNQWPEPPYHWLLPLVFFCVGLMYLFAAPHFEASDNEFHVGVIKWIVDTGELPVQTDEHDYLYGHEANQPPSLLPDDGADLFRIRHH